MINSGLGATIAEKFAAEGANVVINYVSSEDRAKETEAKINSQYAVKTAIVQGVRSLFFYLQIFSNYMGLNMADCIPRIWE